MKTIANSGHVLHRAIGRAACAALLGFQGLALAAPMAPTATVATGEEAAIAAAKPAHRRHVVLKAPVKPAPAPQSKPQEIAVVRR